MQPDIKKLSLKKTVENLGRDLDADFINLLRLELDELAQISHFTESIKTRLDSLYAEFFPKKCSSCSKMFPTREDFIRETSALQGKSTVFDERGVQEYRNCTCGSTLLLWTDDRRDMSEFGKARRKIFDQCLKKLKKLSFASETDLKEKLRGIFSILGM